jgi:hypothetical protein
MSAFKTEHQHRQIQALDDLIELVEAVVIDMNSDSIEDAARVCKLREDFIWKYIYNEEPTK